MCDSHTHKVISWHSLHLVPAVFTSIRLFYCLNPLSSKSFPHKVQNHKAGSLWEFTTAASNPILYPVAKGLPKWGSNVAFCSLQGPAICSLLYTLQDNFICKYSTKFNNSTLKKFCIIVTLESFFSFVGLSLTFIGLSLTFIGLSLTFGVHFKF